MLKLFFKDVRAGAVFLWAAVPLNAVLALQTSRSGAAFFWANVACGAFILGAACMLEWKNDTDTFVQSLPVTRAMVVRARYVTAAAIGALSLSIAAVVGAARGMSLAARGMPWPRAVSGEAALAFLLAFAVIAAVYLPCYFRWGFGKGNVAAAFVIASGIVVSSIAGRSDTGLRVLEASETSGAAVIPGRIPQGVSALVDRVGLGAGSLIVLALAAGLLLVSARLAVRAYERREF